MNPPEELFPGVKWEWQEDPPFQWAGWSCWAGELRCLYNDDGAFLCTDGFPGAGSPGPVGQEGIEWLRKKVIAHLRSLVAPTGMRLVTVEQLEELACATAQDMSFDTAETNRRIDAAWEAVGGRP